MNIDDFIVDPSISIQKVMSIMTENKKGIVLVVEHKKFLGVITDGDIRRGLSDNILISSPVSKLMNINPVFANAEKEAIQKLQSNPSLLAVPVLTTSGELEKIVVTHNKKCVTLSCKKTSGKVSGKDKQKPVVMALIPARGGSKRIPHKNLVKVFGRPLIYWAIKTAKDSEMIASDKILVSTDDKEIAEFAETSGIQIPWMRPSELSQDDTSTVGVVLHALNWATKFYDPAPEYCVLLEPTSPLRTPKHIDTSVRLLQESDADSVISMSQIPHIFHPEEVLTIQKDHVQPFLADRTMDTRKLRGKQKPAYIPNGLIYTFRIASALKYKSLYGKKVIPYITEWSDFVDIDTEDDLKIAEEKMKQRHFMYK